MPPDLAVLLGFTTRISSRCCFSPPPRGLMRGALPEFRSPPHLDQPLDSASRQASGHGGSESSKYAFQSNG